MSDILDHALTALSARLKDGFDGIAKFRIEQEGCLMVDADGVRIGDEDADVTMTASVDTFRGIMDGSVNPTMAFMSGRLRIEGNMGTAMKLGAALS